MSRRLALLALVIVLVITTSTWALMRRHARKLANQMNAEIARREERPVGVLRIVQHASSVAAVLPELRSRYEPWAGTYRGVLENLLKAGYAIKPLEEFDPDRLSEKIVYLRHDIHDRDISGAACMMDLENELNVGSTYYLLWNYSEVERARRDDFLSLRKLAGPGHRFGLHHSLVEEFIYRVHFQGKKQALSMDDMNAFAKTPLFEELWNTTLRKADPDWPKTKCCIGPDQAESPALRKLLRYARTRLREHLEDMREHFGPVSTLAAHGGILVDLTVAQRKNRPHAESDNMCSESLFSQRFLAEQGIRFDVYQLLHQYDMPKVSDNENRWDEMQKELQAARKHGGAFVMLIHPYLWEAKIIEPAKTPKDGW